MRTWQPTFSSTRDWRMTEQRSLPSCSSLLPFPSSAQHTDCTPNFTVQLTNLSSTQQEGRRGESQRWDRKGRRGWVRSCAGLHAQVHQVEVVCRKVRLGSSEVGVKKVRQNSNIHMNSNGMFGVCLGEIYHLILDALCEHWGGERLGVKGLR